MRDDRQAEAGLSQMRRPAFAGEGADVLLGQSGVEKRSGNAVLRGCGLAGAEVALVVEVHSVGDGFESASRAEILHHREEFVLAVEAAGGIVADVLRAVEFAGRNNFKRNALLASEGDSVGELEAGEAGRVGDDRQQAVAEGLVSGPGQECGVSAAGVGDQSAAERAQRPVERGTLGGEIGG